MRKKNYAGGCRPASSDPDRIDAVALNAVAFRATAVLIDGVRLAVLIPKSDWRGDRFDHMSFDRAVCAAGLKAFVRPVTPSDQPNPLHRVSGPLIPLGTRFTTDWLRVTKLASGVRLRQEVTIIWNNGKRIESADRTRLGPTTSN
jgi:hypothetical protein